ncbi:hypothetical protein PR048_027969 [Dryococelus australis]|uniref:Uncharacterized protein n=1 Tax=Dryococelus australis TaxID=614101 RepID=A0ABQ9GHX5_9NEOP|nr:hypothetical protein PR048_027969 [Dryococelus australis]
MLPNRKIDGRLIVVNRFQLTGENGRRSNINPFSTEVIYKLKRGRGGVVARLLASHLGEPGSIPGGVAPGFSHVGIVPDDVAGRRVFSGISRFPHPLISALLHTHLTSPSSALNLKTSLSRAREREIPEKPTDQQYRENPEVTPLGIEPVSPRQRALKENSSQTRGLECQNATPLQQAGRLAAMNSEVGKHVRLRGAEAVTTHNLTPRPPELLFAEKISELSALQNTRAQIHFRHWMLLIARGLRCLPENHRHSVSKLTNSDWLIRYVTVSRQRQVAKTKGKRHVSMEQRRSERTGETGDPREKPTASSGTIPTCENPQEGAVPYAIFKYSYVDTIARAVSLTRHTKLGAIFINGAALSLTYEANTTLRNDEKGGIFTFQLPDGLAGRPAGAQLTRLSSPSPSGNARAAHKGRPRAGSAHARLSSCSEPHLLKRTSCLAGDRARTERETARVAGTSGSAAGSQLLPGRHVAWLA